MEEKLINNAIDLMINQLSIKLNQLTEEDKKKEIIDILSKYIDLRKKND